MVKHMKQSKRGWRWEKWTNKQSKRSENCCQQQKTIRRHLTDFFRLNDRHFKQLFVIDDEEVQLLFPQTSNSSYSTSP